MDNRTELLESALDHVPQAVALLSPEKKVLLWNRQAQMVTGYLSAEMLGRALPGPLEPLTLHWLQSESSELFSAVGLEHGTLVHVENKAGQPLNAMTQVSILRNSMGRQAGLAIYFQPTEASEGIPMGACAGSERVRASQAEFQQQIDTAFADYKRDGLPFGVLWVMVDQAAELRKTHGAPAVFSLMEKVERALSNGLRQGEALGRWGDDEFLVVAHERNTDRLEHYARALLGLAKSTDFRWWGDKLGITVSIGGAQAEPEMKLAAMLEAAKASSMASSMAGGNRITLAPRRQE